MADYPTTRREYLLAAGAAGVTGLAGCSSEGLDDVDETRGGNESTDGGTTPADTETTGDATETATTEESGADGETTREDDETAGEDDDAESESDEETISLSGRLVDSSGAGISSGNVLALGGPDDHSEAPLNPDGSFSLDLTAGSQYSVQYTQGPDGLPDLYTLARLTPESDADLGTVELPQAHEVDIAVETAAGEDVTDDARITVSHENDGVRTGYGLLDNPIELAGNVSIRAEHDGAEVRESFAVTGPRSVTLTLGDGTDDGESVTVSGRLVDSSGTAVSAGEAISLGDPEGLVSVAPDADGRFQLDLTAGSEYSLQYTQGADGYPTDGLPDLFSLGRVAPDSDVDLGTIGLPDAYEVGVTVENDAGEDVTAEARVVVSHENDGAVSGFELNHDPVELVGDVTFRAEYDGNETTETATVTEARSVTLTVGGDSDGSGSGTVAGRLVDSSGSGVGSGRVLALGGPGDLVDVSPDGDGSFALDLESGSRYSLQYTQGPDGLPDLFTIDRVNLDGEVDLGTITLPPAYDVEIAVETAAGEDVTDDARIVVSHENDGVVTGYGLLDNPIQLAGNVSIRAEYDGDETSRDLTVSGSESVTLTLG